MAKHIALVVEGRGEREAVPMLVRDYLHSRSQYELLVGKPLVANGRDKILKPGELERFVMLAASEPGACGVLVVLDAEGDPACERGPECSDRAAAATGLPTRVCLAVRQFENWIIGSAETVFGADSEAQPLADPEGRGASVEVERGLRPTKYNKPIHQPSLTKRVDIDLARSRCPSFDRLFRCIDELSLACA